MVLGNYRKKKILAKLHNEALEKNKAKFREERLSAMVYKALNDGEKMVSLAEETKG